MEAESGKIPPVRAVSNRIILSRSAFRIKFITIIICRNNICCYFCFRFTRSEGRKIPLSRPERLFFRKTPRMNRKDFHRPRPAGIAARTETPLPPAGVAETAGGIPSPERNHGTDSYQSTHNNYLKNHRQTEKTEKTERRQRRKGSTAPGQANSNLSIDL